MPRRACSRCNDCRNERHKIAKVQGTIARNLSRLFLRAWMVHCQTLRHRRARLIQINAYFHSRTVRIAFQKWKALTRKIKRLLYPEQVQQEEMSDRLRKLQVLRSAFRAFSSGVRRSGVQRSAATRVLRMRERLMRSSVLRHWLSRARTKRVWRQKVKK